MTMPDGYSSNNSSNSPKKSDGKSVLGAVVVLAIVITVSVLIANGIWDFTHDNGESNVKIKADGCELTGTGSIKISSIISNSNNFPIIVEWEGNGQVGYAKVPAKTQVSDHVYSYRSADSCSRSIMDVTRN